MTLLGLEARPARRKLLALALGALAIEMRAVELLAELAQRALPMIETRARDAQIGAHFFLVSRVGSQGLVGRLEGGLERRQLGGGPLELGAHPSRDRITLAPLFLGALA